MYVADQSDGKVYTYNMPDAIDARLASLTLSGVEIGGVRPWRHRLRGRHREGVTETTVEAAAMQRRTNIDIDPPDANEAVEGHQVALERHRRDHRHRHLGRRKPHKDLQRACCAEVAAGPSASCLRGDIAEGFSLLVAEGGTLEGLVACAEGRDVVALYALPRGRLPLVHPRCAGLRQCGFTELYADGVPALTPLIAGSNGLPVRIRWAIPA